MQQFICNRIHDVSTEAMKIIMNYFYDNKFEKEGISRKSLEEVLILAHFFVLEGRAPIMFYYPRLSPPAHIVHVLSRWVCVKEGV